MPHEPAAQSNREDVIAKERRWHEEEAQRRFSLDRLLYAPPTFDAVVADGFSFLNLSNAADVLDMGCGEGKETQRLAERGMTVVSVDLSHAQLCRARERVRQHAADATAAFIQANAERLPFRSDSFHHIYGKAVLHHLDVDISAREIRRLLDEGGRATLAEPMAAHPLFWSARKLTPTFRTRDEHPLTCAELRRFMSTFDRPHVRFFFLFTPLSYVFRVLPNGERLFRRVHDALHRLDQWLFARVPWLTRFAWYDMVNVEVSKPGSNSAPQERQYHRSEQPR